MAENTDTATVVEEKPVRVKKDPSTILPNVPAEYKNPETGRYLPGRDARHASDVAKAIIGGADEGKALAALGSDVLRAKALKQVENHNERLAKQGIEGEVTVKGEQYDARKVRGSGAVRYDGPKGWVEVDADNRIAKTFQSRADLDKAAQAEGEAADEAEAVDAE